jgi:fatty-acyl-CoA synthase
VTLIMPLPVLRLYNCYGRTETAPLASILRPEEHDDRERLASAGRPVLNVATRVVDPEMNDTPPYKAGEIGHRSPHLLSGYWEKLEETGKAFGDGWFHSGDLGYFDEDGYLYVVDKVAGTIGYGDYAVQITSLTTLRFRVLLGGDSAGKLEVMRAS